MKTIDFKNVLIGVLLAVAVMGVTGAANLGNTDVGRYQATAFTPSGGPGVIVVINTVTGDLAYGSQEMGGLKWTRSDTIPACIR